MLLLPEIEGVLYNKFLGSLIVLLRQPIPKNDLSYNCFIENNFIEADLSSTVVIAFHALLKSSVFDEYNPPSLNVW